MTDFSAPLVAEPDYYITTVSVCQGFFQTFLKFFQIYFFNPLELPVLGATCLLYYILFRLSRGFLKKVSKNRKKLF